jgi:hypothetical protein
MMGAKVFTATKAKDRDELGEVLTRWIHDNPKARIIDKVVTQSSDREFHCLSITIFYEMQPAVGAPREGAPSLPRIGARDAAVVP